MRLGAAAGTVDVELESVFSDCRRKWTEAGLYRGRSALRSMCAAAWVAGRVTTNRRPAGGRLSTSARGVHTECTA